LPKHKWLDFPNADKIIHTFLFLVEAFLLGLMVRFELNVGRAFTILIGCFLLGGGLEIVQHYWVDGRNGDVADLIADFIGTVTGVALSITIFSSKKRFME